MRSEFQLVKWDAEGRTLNFGERVFGNVVDNITPDGAGFFVALNLTTGEFKKFESQDGAMACLEEEVNIPNHEKITRKVCERLCMMINCGGKFVVRWYSHGVVNNLRLMLPEDPVTFYTDFKFSIVGAKLVLKVYSSIEAEDQHMDEIVARSIFGTGCSKACLNLIVGELRSDMAKFIDGIWDPNDEYSDNPEWDCNE